MVIHCDYGVSRSAAVAVGWLIYNDDRASIYKIYHDKKHIPNRYIVEKFYKRLNKTMKYIDKWEKEKFESDTPEDAIELVEEETPDGTTGANEENTGSDINDQNEINKEKDDEKNDQNR
jgi:hypothetical protein